MKRINFTTGLLNRFLAVMLALVGITFITRLTGDTVASYIANTPLKKILITAAIIIGIEVVALVLFIISSKSILKSLEDVDYSAGRKGRVIGTIINILIVGAIIGVLVWLGYKTRAAILQWSVMELVMVALSTLVAILQFILLIIKFGIVIKHQRIKKIKFANIDDTVKKEEKIEKTKKTTKVEQKDVSIEQPKPEVQIKKNTDNLVKPHFRNTKK